MGNRIKIRRKELRIKQAELAERLNISNNHMSSIENVRQKPSLDIFIQICNLLNVTPDYLLLGSMHAYNIPQDIIDKLRLCNQSDIELAGDFIELLVKRNNKATHLDEAMRFHVFRYLSKPLDKQRFFRNLKDALAYYNSITLKIPVETKQAVYSFPASQIIAIEAQGRKVIVHTARQDFDSIHNMNYWLEKLPQNSFFQTHRSFIVNFEHIVDFDHSTVHLSNPQITAYLTRRKYSSFRNAYLLYLESMR